MTATFRRFFVAVLAGGVLLSGQTASSNPPDGGWVSLFNGKNFDGWYTFLASTGKNANPKKVCKVESGMVHILDIPEKDDSRIMLQAEGAVPKRPNEIAGPIEAPSMTLMS